MPKRKNEKILGTSGTDIVFLPILVFKTGYQDFSSALARCVNKLAVIEINADMGKRFAIGIEENQIAGMHLIFRDHWQRAPSLLLCAAGNALQTQRISGHWRLMLRGLLYLRSVGAAGQ